VQVSRESVEFHVGVGKYIYIILNNTAFDQDRREFGGGPGKFFLGAPISKFFSNNNNPLRQLRENDWGSLNWSEHF
jgi:hypothetical protein